MSRDVTELPPVPADERVPYGKDLNQFFDLWHPQGTVRGSVVMIHGGFWRARYDLSHASHLCAALARQGIATANLEYRRVGNPGGGWPGTFDDVAAGVRAAADRLRDFGDPIVLGHSAGGHLALRLASKNPPARGVVALAPVADLRLCYELNLSNGAVVEFLGGAPVAIPDIYDEACPTKRGMTIPCTVLHGTADDTVPFSMSIRFAIKRGLDRSRVRLLALAGVNHFDLIDPESKAWHAVSRAVGELL